MKTCTTCKEVKPVTEFHKDARSASGYCHECKICRNRRTREHHRRHYIENKEAWKASVQRCKSSRRDRFNEWKATLVCSQCGENSTCCLDFHHLDPSLKEIGIARALDHWAWSRLMAEVDKCVVLCANCHRKVHAGIITV